MAEEAGRGRTVLVVGTGLIGTSIALALGARGHRVLLADADSANLRVAADMTGATPDTGEPAGVAVVAVPPQATAAVAAQLLRDARAETVTDTAGIKSGPLREITAALANGPAVARYVGGHPLAGRERSGPRAAREDLFAGRPWVLTPGAASSPAAMRDARWLAEACQASPVVMSVDEHDRAVAITSHLPQIVASALAAQLGGESDAVIGLVGRGLRDMTRIAASDAQLWAGIAAGNAGPLREVLERFDETLRDVTAALGESPAAAEASVRELVLRGGDGRRRMPGKHGGAPRAYRTVPVVVRDTPGQMARLLADAADAGVNIEDLRVDHAPGLPVGVIELFVAPESEAALSAALAGRGWTVTTAETSEDLS